VNRAGGGELVGCVVGEAPNVSGIVVAKEIGEEVGGTIGLLFRQDLILRIVLVGDVKDKVKFPI
jgi:hypothetical protein